MSEGTESIFQTMGSWLRAMVDHQLEHGADFVPCDDPYRRLLGIKDTETEKVFFVTLTGIKSCREWEHLLPPEHVRTLEGRRQLARMLSTGDHCLVFDE